MRTRIDRRELLIRVTGAATAALWPGHATAQDTKTRLILLGTGGGPRPRKASSAPAQVIVINGTPYVVDCGDGIARQLVFANVAASASAHLPHAPSLGPQRRLRQPDLAVTVTAALVNHPPVVPAFSYRFDARDRSIVISGDTARSDNLVKLARGADVLVHTAVYVPALDRLVARVLCSRFQCGRAHRHVLLAMARPR